MNRDEQNAKLGNKVRQEGIDRCAACGCKYWEHDACIDCGGTEIELPFCDDCRESRGFLDSGSTPGWCGNCFGGYVGDEMYDAINEACDALNAIEEAQQQ